MTDREELVRQAADLVPVLLEQAPEVENQRCIPQETVNRLIAAGFLRAIHPIRFGGMGLDCDVALDIAAELGRLSGYVREDLRSKAKALSRIGIITPIQTPSPPGKGYAGCSKTR